MYAASLFDIVPLGLLFITPGCLSGFHCPYHLSVVIHYREEWGYHEQFLYFFRNPVFVTKVEFFFMIFLLIDTIFIL